MTILYQKNMQNIYNWRERHHEEYLVINRKYNNRCYHWRQIRMKFLKIMLEDEKDENDKKN